MAWVTLSEVGFSLGWNRAITSPFRLTRNLVKFQEIVAGEFGVGLTRS